MKTTIVIDRPIAAVWQGIVDAETYPRWLIGAQAVHAPATWPTPGSTFAHRIGAGPIRLPGSTTSHELSAPERFRLGAGMGPLGEADVTFELQRLDSERTQVTMTEVASAGLVGLLNRIAHPLVELAIGVRNRGSLERLKASLT